MIYLASNYSHPDPVVMDDRAAEAQRASAHFLKQGFPIFSPIAHWHPIAKSYGLPREYAFWKTYNLAMLRASRELWVLTLDGWKESRGVTDEIEHAHKWSISVVLRQPPPK
ncbi:MAG: DUF1937 family protein [Planctomycetota bacterium]|jgi:hypothetical protein